MYSCHLVLGSFTTFVPWPELAKLLKSAHGTPLKGIPYNHTKGSSFCTTTVSLP